MQDRIALGRFVDEGLVSRNQQRALRIQPSTFGTVVSGVQDDAVRQLALNSQVPDLHVGEAVVGIDREIVGHGAGLRARKAIGQCQGVSGREAREVRCIRLSVGERRLKRKVLYHRAVLCEVVIDAVAGTQHHFLFRLPGDAHARREIVAVRPDQGIREHAVVGPGLACQDGHSRGKTGRHVQVCNTMVRFGVRAVVFVAQAQIERQTRPEPPVILNEKIVRVGAEIIGIGPELKRSLLWIAQ